MKKHIALALAASLSALTQAAEIPEPEWSFGLQGDISRQEYAKGTLRTWEAVLSPAVSLGNLQLFVDAPYYNKQADFSGAVKVYGPRGRLIGQVMATKQQQFEGMGDITLGGSYALPLENEALGISAGLTYKLDNGDAAQLLGSDSRDLSVSLDGQYTLDKLTLQTGIGHTWIDSNQIVAGNVDAYLFWSAGIRVKALDGLSLGISFSDQDEPYLNAPDQAITRLSASWGINKILTLKAGFGRYAAQDAAGQPETETSLGLVWQL